MENEYVFAGKALDRLTALLSAVTTAKVQLDRFLKDTTIILGHDYETEDAILDRSESGGYKIIFTPVEPTSME